MLSTRVSERHFRLPRWHTFAEDLFLAKTMRESSVTV